MKNHKQLGEIGERIAIGELAKFGIDVLLPMSDNLPFDFVIYSNNKFFKCQVKTTEEVIENNTYRFSLTSNNWNKGISYFYTEEDYDVLICCNLKTIFLFSFEETRGRHNINLRETPSLNNQVKNINFCRDFVISEERLKALGIL